MGSGGDNELPSDRVTLNVRIYRGDLAMVKRIARTKNATRWSGHRALTPADVIHELLEPVRKAEQERGSGH